MVAQHQEIGGAQVGLQARFLVIPKGHALVGVVRQRGQHKGGLLADGQHATGLRADAYARTRVGVQHAARVFPRFVHGAVDHKARRVDREGRVGELVALLVDLDQAAGGDLVKHQPVGVDQEMVLRPGDAGADVGEDQVAPAVGGYQAVAGGQVDAQCPLFGADLCLK